MNRPLPTPFQSPAGPGAFAAGDDAAWVEWLDGWYWQTDEHHALTLLRPPAGATATDWLLARKWCAPTGPWWAAAGTACDASQAQWTSLEMGLKASVRIDATGPVSPYAPQGGSASESWQVLGVPRREPSGAVMGHHGVWRRVEPRARTSDPASSGVDLPAVGLARMNEVEQEALRYAISHDLRAPLRSVDGFSRILREDYGHVLDRVGKDHLDRVLAAAHRMGGMIDAILAQAQLARAPLSTQEVDLSALARDVVRDLDATAEHARPSRGQVRWLIADGMRARADASLLRRVIENLLGNALKYSSKVAQPRIQVGVVPATDPQVFFVRDNGAGFDMQHAEKLFGLFQRLHSNQEFPGTGVGLAGVHHIIQRHGGKVWAEALPGQGACFYFTLASNLR